MSKELENKTVFITGASRGIGREIALECAKAGANIVITAKSVTENEKLPGTIYSVAEEIEALGAKALAIAVDVRFEEQIQQAVAQAVEKFGGIDVLINNASAISLTNTEQTPVKRFDLMMSVNARATFACSQACLPHLKKSANPHILNLSPPLNMQPKWFAPHVAYTMSKYGMSMCTLGMAEEFKAVGIAVNSLWPKTAIATAAIKNHFPPAVYEASRSPEIVAKAALLIITQKATQYSGQFFIDEEVLQAAGDSDLDRFAINPKAPLFPDLFLD